MDLKLNWIYPGPAARVGSLMCHIDPAAPAPLQRPAGPCGRPGLAGARASMAGDTAAAAAAAAAAPDGAMAAAAGLADLPLSLWQVILGAVLVLYFGWLLSRLSCYLTLNKIPCHLPGTWIGGNVWELAGLPKVKYAGKPDTQGLFKDQAEKALAKGDGLFRIAFFRYIPFLSREWVVVADWELAKELLAQDTYGKFDKGSMYKLANPLIGHGILAQVLSKWLANCHALSRTRAIQPPRAAPHLSELALTARAV